MKRCVVGRREKVLSLSFFCQRAHHRELEVAKGNSFQRFSSPFIDEELEPRGMMRFSQSA